MIVIRPISDLRNSFSKIEEIVLKENKPIYLTKNGYGSMVVMSIQKYSELVDNIDLKLDEADELASKSTIRYSHDKVFSDVRRRINEQK